MPTIHRRTSRLIASRREFLKYAAASFGAVAFTGCSEQTETPVKAPERPVSRGPNILVLSVDTLRADHLGCYGYARDTSPNIDALASKALLYRDAQAPAPWTLPSHASMLTGRHAFDLGIVSEQSAMPADVSSVASVLFDAGYTTAGFVDSSPAGFVGADRGFDRGFETYGHAPFVDGLLYNYDMSATVDAALQWIENRETSRPFFLFLHTKSVHDTPRANRKGTPGWPYEIHEPFGSKFLTPQQKALEWNPPFAEYFHTHNRYLVEGIRTAASYEPERIDALRGQYDGGIAYTDHHFGRLLEALKTLEIDDNTAVVVAADHGEAFLEHRHFAHVEIYNQLTHIPMIIRAPDGPARAIDSPVSLQDVPATILKFAGIDSAQHAIPGNPFPESADVETSDEPIFAYYRDDTSPFPDQYALRKGQWRLIYNADGQTLELYDAVNDRADQSPIEGHEDIKVAMSATLLEWVNQRADSPEHQIELTESDQEHLRSLGYFD